MVTAILWGLGAIILGLVSLLVVGKVLGLIWAMISDSAGLIFSFIVMALVALAVIMIL